MSLIQKKKQPVRNDSVIEQLRGVGGGVADSVKTDVIGGITSGIFNDLFAPKTDNLNSNQETVFQPEAENYSKPVVSEFRKPEVVLFSAQDANLNREVEMVRAELKKTILELKELNSAVLEVEKTVALAPVKAGRYHISFFARLRTILKLFRQQISESRVWLEASFSRKKKKGYWSMFKKHGTSFAMSNERALASQAG